MFLNCLREIYSVAHCLLIIDAVMSNQAVIQILLSRVFKVEKNRLTFVTLISFNITSNYKRFVESSVIVR